MCTAIDNPVASTLAGIWRFAHRPRLSLRDVYRAMEIPRPYFSPGPSGRVERDVLVTLAIECAQGKRNVDVEWILARERLSRLQLRDAVASLQERRLLAIKDGLVLLRLPEAVAL